MCALLALTAISAVSQIPNQYYFVSATYFASQGTTNAAVTVRFVPGTRGWNGIVNYSTGGGTAVVNQDYAPVSGAMSFSGNSYGTFTVPVNCDSSNQDTTVSLLLSASPSDADAIISRSNAVLTINLPPPPNLRIMPGQNGTVIISWPDDGTDVFLEKQASPAENWSPLYGGSLNGGVRSYTDVAIGGTTFYRLRRPQ
jgi:hypothetical protein